LTFEESPMIEPPTIQDIAAQSTAVIHLTIPREEIRQVMGPGYGALMSTLAAQGIVPAGRWFSYHFKMDPKTFDFEIGIPVDRPVSPAGRVKPGQLPAATVARTVYHGPYEGLSGAWQEFERWIAAQGRTSAPSLWETSLTDPAANPDPTTWRTELTRPVTKSEERR
jgi:effector-binding domain-containing protein